MGLTVMEKRKKGKLKKRIPTDHETETLAAMKKLDQDASSVLKIAKSKKKQIVKRPEPTKKNKR